MKATEETTDRPDVGSAAAGSVPVPVRGVAAKITLVVLGALALALAAIIMWGDQPREATGGCVVALVIVLLISGMHIAVAILIPSTLGVLALSSSTVLTSSFEDQPYTAVASWQYSVIPFFVLMGMALWRSGISAKAFGAARQWLGNVPGGLAIGTVTTGGALAAASGSTIGIAYALGRVSLPEMLRARYSPGIAIGAVSVAGILGQIIPPSVMLVVYASLVQTSISDQLLAGLVPGLILLIAFSVMILAVAVFKPDAAPSTAVPGVTWGSRVKSLGGAVPLVVVIVVIIGGMLSGTFTATEGGAVGAFLALVLGAAVLPRSDRTVGGIVRFFRETALAAVYSTAAVFLLLIAVYVFTRVLTLSQLAQTLARVVGEMGLSRLTLLLLLIPVILLAGCFLDTLSILLVMVPVLLPTIVAFDIDLIWFGVFVVILAEMGVITPPLGILIFIVHRLAQDAAPKGTTITLLQAFSGVGWFVLASTGVVLLLVFIPELATWLPSVSGAQG